MLPILIPKIHVKMFMKIDQLFYTQEKSLELGGYASSIMSSQRNWRSWNFEKR